MTELAALVARRLCHDFAGPIGASATAVEMLGTSDDAEVRALISDSARGLAASLRLYRVVLAPGSTPVAAHDLEALLTGWTQWREGVTVDWAVAANELDADRAAMLLGLALVATEALARGGSVRVSEDGVTASGPNLRLDADVRAALDGARDALSPRAALARVVVANANSGGLAIMVDFAPTEFSLSFANSGAAR